MADDETVDFITEVYEGENTDANWFIYEDTEYEPGLSNENSNIVVYASDEDEFVDELDISENQDDFEASNFVEEQSAGANEVNTHSLILKEIINEHGLQSQTYFCQDCMVEYDDINDYLSQHKDVQLLNENPEEGDNTLMQTSNVQDKLGDLIEDLREVMSDTEEVGVVEDNFAEVKVEEMENEPQTETLDTENDRYYCYECQQVFTDLTTAEQHDCTQSIEEHKSESLEEMVDYIKDESQEVVNFACAYCSQVFSSYDDLLNHIANCKKNVPTSPNGTGAYHCEMCNKDYNTLRSFNSHMRLHKKAKNGILPSMSGPIVCEICNTKFASAKNLSLHMKMHNERTIKSIQEALPAGAQTEYNELNQFYCEICNKSFDQRLLDIHKNMHQNTEEYNCSRCNKQFENLLSYEMHTQMHAENRMIAAKTDSNVDPLKNTDAQTSKKYPCQYCGKHFNRPYEKVKHERVHTGEKPYSCEVCGKSFRVSYSLTLHLRTHTDIRPYVCATCNKRFKQQSVYVHHLKTHLAERQYICDECGKGFRTSVQLRGHKNCHNKPFNCTECNRPFASLYSVKIHMQTHNKSHKSNKNLKNRCTICGASYARLFALRYHIQEKHNVNLDPSQFLNATYATSSAKQQKRFDDETTNKLKAAVITGSEDSEVDDVDEEIVESVEDLAEDCNVDDCNADDVDDCNADDDLDETAAATKTILNAFEEVITDDFHSEEIVTDW